MGPRQPPGVIVWK